MTHFFTYMMHYVIARTVYDGAREMGISAVLMVAGAVIALLLFSGVARFSFTRSRVRREARWREDARLDARRRWNERHR